VLLSNDMLEQMDAQNCTVHVDIFFFVALRPNAGHGLLILDHTQRRTTVGRTPLDK